MTSATTGPLLGVFILAMFCPSANWKGAVAGMIVSHVVILWIAIGSLLVKEPPRDLPTSIEGCSNMTFGPHIPLYHQSALLPLINDSNHLIDQFEEGLKIRQLNNVVNDMSVIHFIYRISYMYYAMMGTLLTVVVGLLVSCFASCTSEDEFEYNEKLLHPLVLKLRQQVCWTGNKRWYSTKTNLDHINTISKNGINGTYKEKPPG
uniref:Sodium/iodide cotransporter n=2 Tax=Cacopsylla melanoneura TaxID=428564 RepID=A0A8D8M5W6_9HEMI